jgi:glycosyltransferase involved in cell wall biosynthesis
MKIIQLVQKRQRRGAEVFAFQLTRELRRKFHDVKLIYLYPYYGESGLTLGEGDAELDGQEFALSEKFPGYHPRLLSQLQRMISEFKPDIIQSNGARTVKYGALAHRGNQAKWALIYRNIGNPADWVRGWSRRLFYRKVVMPQVDGVVGVSQVTLKKVQEFYGLSIPMTNIPRGIDEESFVPQKNREEIRRKFGTPNGHRIILFVGSLSYEKRPDRFLRIFTDLKSKLPDIQAWVVGDGPMKSSLQQQAATASLQKDVRFLGVQEDVASIMNAADLLTLTSDTEGIPGVALEAGLLGLPVVAANVGGVAECVVHEKTGIVIDPNDELKFAQSALDLLRDHQKYRSMGANARDWIRQNFGIEKIASRYIEFYEFVARESARRHSGSL